MHSSSAACVFGDARLISSTSRRFAKTGPGRNSNSFERWLKTFTPVTSEGSRSGVNCMRENETSRLRASAFASIVSAAAPVSTRSLRDSLTQQLLRPVYDRGRDLVFRRLWNALFPGRADKDDLVLLRVEADVI